MYACSCWQCSDKTRKYRGHINTFGTKEKFIFLEPTQKKPVCKLERAPEIWWPGTRTLLSPTLMPKKGKITELLQFRPQLVIVLVKFLPICYLVANSQDLGFWCPGTRTLVPLFGENVCRFNLKNGLPEYDFLVCDKCIYVPLIFSGFIGVLPAWTSVHFQEN